MSFVCKNDFDTVFYGNEGECLKYMTDNKNMGYRWMGEDVMRDHILPKAHYEYIDKWIQSYNFDKAVLEIL